MKKNFHFIWLLSMLFLPQIFTGCASFAAFSCRHEISDVSIEVSGENSGLRKQNAGQGLFFTFQNFSEQTVTAITVCYKVCLSEASRESSFEDENLFECNSSSCAVFRSCIPQGCSESFIISLDDCFYEESEHVLQVDFIYVSEIQYADGSVWKDVYGTFGF